MRATWVLSLLLPLLLPLGWGTSCAGEDQCQRDADCMPGSYCVGNGGVFSHSRYCLPKPIDCAAGPDFEGCACDEDREPTRPCYNGPPATRGVGVCRGGLQECFIDSFERCTNAVLPSKEVCNDKLDNNCDGLVDEAPCIPGPPKSQNARPNNPMGNDVPSFSVIAQILRDADCFRCHAENDDMSFGSFNVRAADVDRPTNPEIRQALQNTQARHGGMLVTPTQLNESSLYYCLIGARDVSRRCEQVMGDGANGTLDSQQTERIRRWIEGGAPFDN